jgi:cell division protein FtsN
MLRGGPMASRSRRGGGGMSTFFVAVGGLAILGATFVLGLMVGRFWPGLPPVPSAAVAKAPRERVRERETRAPETPPRLTFYEELTAPLTAPPAARPAKPRAETARAEATKPEPPKADKAEALAPPAPGRFTVQVGAYKAREPAEALRARLAAAGHDAYVAEMDVAVRFRVRVGAYATREAAREAAVRIAAGRAFSTYVTAR